MAQYSTVLNGDFNQIRTLCYDAVMGGSSTVSFEGESSYQFGDTYVQVMVFERYSMMGGNRVSLSLTLAGDLRETFVTAFTSGGSQAMFFKINTFGEEAFLDTLVPALEQYAARHPRI